MPAHKIVVMRSEMRGWLEGKQVGPPFAQAVPVALRQAARVAVGFTIAGGVDLVAIRTQAADTQVVQALTQWGGADADVVDIGDVVIDAQPLVGPPTVLEATTRPLKIGLSIGSHALPSAGTISCFARKKWCWFSKTCTGRILRQLIGWNTMPAATTRRVCCCSPLSDRTARLQRSLRSSRSRVSGVTGRWATC